MMILNQKRTHAVIAFHNGTDALYANAMPGFMGYRNSIFKGNRILAGVFNLQEESFFLIEKPHINDAGLFCGGDRQAGVECIFQRIGEKHTQITV